MKSFKHEEVIKYFDVLLIELIFTIVKQKKIRHNKSSIDRKLHRNYCIIIELIKDNEIINCSKDFLLGKGFDFGVLTHFNEYNNNRYPSIYDFMFYEKDNEVYFQKIIE